MGGVVVIPGTNSIWITNGIEESRILLTDAVPLGYKKGRTISCTFKDSVIQKSNSDRWQKQKGTPYYSEVRNKAAIKMMKVRDHSKCGVVGENHPCKREEVKKKIALRTSKPITINGVWYASIKEACNKLNLKRHQIDRIRDDRNQKDR
jgi:hypothetical protein